jgi:hypothetical protein
MCDQCAIGTHRAVFRYGFGFEVSDGQHDAFLEELHALCLQDAYEAAMGGDGDQTGILLSCEIEGAEERIALPTQYWKRRPGRTDEELASAMNDYRG